MLQHYLSRTVAVFVPVLYALGKVDSQAVRAVQGGDVLQVGWTEHSDHTVSTATEDEVLTDSETTGRRRLNSSSSLN